MNKNTFLYNTILNGMSEKHFLKKMKMTDSEVRSLLLSKDLSALTGELLACTDQRGRFRSEECSWS